MKQTFGKQAVARTSRLIDVKGMRAGPRKDATVEQALGAFGAYYPEFADPSNPDMLEDFSAQLDRGGFLLAIRNTQGKIEGLAAGAVLNASKSANLTYFVPSSNEAANRALRDATSEMLARKGVRLTVIELYEPGTGTPNAGRDEKDRDLFTRQLGFIRAPIQGYRQPVGPDSPERVDGLHPYVLFAPDVAADEKSALLFRHLKAWAQSLDPKLAEPDNKADLARHAKTLNDAQWATPSRDTPRRQPG